MALCWLQQKEFDLFKTCWKYFLDKFQQFLSPSFQKLVWLFEIILITTTSHDIKAKFADETRNFLKYETSVLYKIIFKIKIRLRLTNLLGSEWDGIIWSWKSLIIMSIVRKEFHTKTIRRWFEFRRNLISTEFALSKSWNTISIHNFNKITSAVFWIGWSYSQAGNW